MINPIAMLAVNAGSNLIERLTSGANTTQATPEADNTSAKVKFDAVMQNATARAVEKIIALYPEIRSQLGQGPYTLKPSEGGYTLTDSAGRQAKIDANSSLGQSTTQLVKGLPTSFSEKGLVLQAI